MPYECHYTGKKTTFGKKRAYSGQKITKGGFGLKTTGISRRSFRPNLHKMTAMVDGSPQRIVVSAKAVRMGLVERPLKRKYGYTRLQKEAAGES